MGTDKERESDLPGNGDCPTIAVIWRMYILQNLSQLGGAGISFLCNDFSRLQ
jgi:hypothetical protein